MILNHDMLFDVLYEDTVRTVNRISPECRDEIEIFSGDCSHFVLILISFVNAPFSRVRVANEKSVSKIIRAPRRDF